MTTIDQHIERGEWVPYKLQPTDDELLKFFVDEMPHAAMQDYRRRLCFAPDTPSPGVLRSYFEREWQRRMIES